MEILGMFGNSDIACISKYMGIEFIIGAVIGLVIKKLTIVNFRNTSDLQVISGKEYTSAYPDRNLLTHPFDIFLLTPEFVILKTEHETITKEEFYTFFGASMKISYEKR